MKQVKKIMYSFVCITLLSIYSNAANQGMVQLHTSTQNLGEIYVTETNSIIGTVSYTTQMEKEKQISPKQIALSHRVKPRKRRPAFMYC